ncbi:class I SAM-dependent DNA methyltransferase [Micromonospora sp. PTRAS2]
MGEPNWLRETRAAYDEVAVDYARLVHGELARRPLERALLATFAELVGGGGTTRAAASGPVVEVGCGTGRITAHLCGLGLGVAGLDLSPGMVAVARESWPGLRFGVASMTDLPLPDAGLAGLVAWYSIIHLPPEALPTVFAEFHRVLAPGGELLLAFKAGDRRIRLEQGTATRSPTTCTGCRRTGSPRSSPPPGSPCTPAWSGSRRTTSAAHRRTCWPAGPTTPTRRRRRRAARRARRWGAEEC